MAASCCLCECYCHYSCKIWSRIDVLASEDAVREEFIEQSDNIWICIAKIPIFPSLSLKKLEVEATYFFKKSPFLTSKMANAGKTGL